MVKIVLADDHNVVREALRSTLEKISDMEVVGEADDGREAVRMARDLSPDVVVMDIAMPKLNGVEATRQIVHECPGVKVLALTMHADRLLVSEMLKAGAMGYLIKHCSLAEMVAALRAVADGQTYLSPTVTGPVVDGYLGRRPQSASTAFTVLSPREREVLQLLAEGLGTREIAAQLNISVSTVETHRRKMKAKLGISSFAGLIKFAISEGLTSLDV